MKKAALITGATGSIGHAIAQRVRRDGFHVVGGDLVEPENPDDFDDFCHLDVTSTDSVVGFFESVDRKFEVKSLVCAHGVLRRAAFDQYDEELVQQTLEINLKGVMRLLKTGAGRLSPGSAITLIGSVTASTGAVQGSYVYQAAKAGLEQLTRFHAVALGPQGIRINTVAPGFMENPMRGDGSAVRAAPDNAASGRRATPLGRLVTSSEVAEAAAFLCSDRASAITGITLPVDCGFLAS